MWVRMMVCRGGSVWRTLAHDTTIIPSSPFLPNPFCTLPSNKQTNKTSALLHTVHWARHSGWLVLHVADAKEVMEGGYWVRPSEVTDGDFDQPQVVIVIGGDGSDWWW